jgi:hypothetical protein
MSSLSLSLSLSLWPNFLQMRPRRAQKILLFRVTMGRSPTSTGNYNAAIKWMARCFLFFGWAGTRRSRIDLKTHSKRTMLSWETKNLEVVNRRKTFAQDFENGHFAVSKAKNLGLCVSFSVSLNLDSFCRTRVLYPPTFNQVHLELDRPPH